MHLYHIQTWQITECKIAMERPPHKLSRLSEMDVEPADCCLLILGMFIIYPICFESRGCDKQVPTTVPTKSLHMTGRKGCNIFSSTCSEHIIKLVYRTKLRQQVNKWPRITDRGSGLWFFWYGFLHYKIEKIRDDRISACLIQILTIVSSEKHTRKRSKNENNTSKECTILVTTRHHDYSKWMR